MNRINKKIFVLPILVIIVIINVIIINKSSFSLDENNYKGDYILNYDWVKYMELSDEEKSLY